MERWAGGGLEERDEQIVSSYSRFGLENLSVYFIISIFDHFGEVTTE